MAAGLGGKDGGVSSYRVRRSIGKGSYGEVFLVAHRGDGKQVFGTCFQESILHPSCAVRDEEHKTDR